MNQLNAWNNVSHASNEATVSPIDLQEKNKRAKIVHVVGFSSCTINISECASYESVKGSLPQLALANIMSAT